MELVTTLKHKYNAFKKIFLKKLACFFLELKNKYRFQMHFQKSCEYFVHYFTPFCCLVLTGFHRNSQEKAGLLEAAGPQTAPPVPSESYAGHAWVPSERVRVLAFFYL